MAEEATQDALFGVQRTLKSVEVNGKTFYYYHPMSMAERAAAMRSVEFMPSGNMSIDLEGIVDGLIARLRTSDGNPLYFSTHRRRLLQEGDSDMLIELWERIGGIGELGSMKEAVRSAEKN